MGWANGLGLGGYLKPGSPGIFVFEGEGQPGASASLRSDFNLNALKDTYDCSCSLARLDEYRNF